MRWLLTATLLSSLPMTAHAATYVYVSMAPEQKIATYQLDASTGSLKRVATLDVAGAPGSLAVDPKKQSLFASLRSTSTLASFRIDPATGQLTLLSTAALGKDENAAFVRADQSGRWLISASYAAGKVVVHRLREDGTIESPAVQTIETAKTAHCIAIDRDNRWVFVPHVSPNAVYQFAFDSETGKLTEKGKAPGGAEKAGPRHLAFHPTRSLAFASDESGSSITSYRFDPKTGLKPEQTLSTLPSGYSGQNSTAEVKVHPSGRFVWVSNRGHDSLAGFAIDEAGKLTALGQTPTEKTPRSFEISPDGRYVFGAGEGSGKLATYQVDTNTGTLTRSRTDDIGKSLTWVLAVEIEPPRRGAEKK